MYKTENIFNEIVKTLTDDVASLQQKFHKLQEDNNIKGSIDCLRLLKDTLSLIKEYDWHLEYSEYKTDSKKNKLLFGNRITVEMLRTIRNGIFIIHIIRIEIDGILCLTKQYHLDKVSYPLMVIFIEILGNHTHSQNYVMNMKEL